MFETNTCRSRNHVFSTVSPSIYLHPPVQKLTSQKRFVGINALIYYSPTLFQTMGLPLPLQLLMSGILNITQLLGVLTSLWTMDKLGRRPLLLLGSALMFLSHLIITILVALYSSDWTSHRLQGWASVAMLLFYMLAFGATWGPVPWALPAEVFPTSLRAKGVALSTCSNWGNNFIMYVPPFPKPPPQTTNIFFFTEVSLPPH